MPKGIWKYPLTGYEWVEANMHVNDDGCVPWPRGLTKDGYPDIRSKGRNIRGHRLAMEIHLSRRLHVGEQVLHSCDNRTCVNIQHLRIGTSQQNTQDREDRGRGIKADTHPNAVLNCAVVNQLRAAHKAGVRPKYLVQQFGLKLATIENVIYNRGWKSC